MSLIAGSRFLNIFIRGQLTILRDRLQVATIASRATGARIDPRVIIRVEESCELVLGPNVSIGAFSVIILENDRKSQDPMKTTLSIGRDTYIGEHNNIRPWGSTTIGEKCLISQGVSIIGANHSVSADSPMREQPWQPDKTGVHIGDDVWIGCNAVVLPGVTIGDGAVVAAGSIVNRSVESGAIVAGAPARAIGARK